MTNSVTNQSRWTIAPYFIVDPEEMKTASDFECGDTYPLKVVVREWR